MTTYVRVTVRVRRIGIAIVSLIAGAAALTTWAFLPRLEYLPEGNRNLVFGLIMLPPGYNLDTTETIVQRIEEVARSLGDAASAPATEDGRPTIESFFFVAMPGNSFVGAVSVDGHRRAS